MDMFATFCKQIENGIFDEVEGATFSGSQRLRIGTQPFVVHANSAPEGKITKEQQKELLQRLNQRKLQKLKIASG